MSATKQLLATSISFIQCSRHVIGYTRLVCRKPLSSSSSKIYHKQIVCLFVQTWSSYRHFRAEFVKLVSTLLTSELPEVNFSL